MRANVKARKRLLASLLSLVLVTGMLPVGAFAEGEPPALGADVAAENVKGDEGSAGEKAGDPVGQPGPGGGEGQGNPAPSPSNSGQETPPAAPQENTSSTAPHEHEFGAEWKSDAAKHWHECTVGDGQKADEAAHAFGSWTAVKQATETEPGSKERSCTTCGYAEAQDIPVPDKPADPDDAAGSEDKTASPKKAEASVRGAKAPSTQAATAWIYVATTDESQGLTQLGSWTPNRASGDYIDLGKKVTVRAIPKEGYRFVGWHIGSTPGAAGAAPVSVTSAEYTFSVADETYLFAEFAKITTVWVQASTMTVDFSQGSIRFEGGEEDYSRGGSQFVGSEITVHATPNENYRFVGWHIGNTMEAARQAPVSSTSKTYTFTVEQNTYLVAEFREAVPAYEVRIYSEDEAKGLVTYSYNGGSFPSAAGSRLFTGVVEASVTVKAEPKYGWAFAYWKEGSAIVSTEQSYTFTLLEHRNLTAIFMEDGDNVDVTISPLIWIDGVDETLSAAVTVSGYGNVTIGRHGSSTSRIYYKWFDSYEAAQAEIFMTTDGGFRPMAEEYTAPMTAPMGTSWLKVVALDRLQGFDFTKRSPVFVIEIQRTNPRLSVSSNNELWGSVSGDSGVFTAGTQVTVKATPKAGYRFVKWTGGPAESTDAEYTFTLDKSYEMSAVFEKIPVTYTVTVSADPAAGGRVTGGGTVNEGESAEVRATVSTGFVFNGWYEGTTKVSSNKSYTFTPRGDITLTAKFKKTVNLVFSDVINSLSGLDEEIFITDIDLTNGRQSLPVAERRKTTLTWNGAAVDWWTNSDHDNIMIDSNDLGIGTHTLTLDYPGSDEYCAASVNITVIVVKKLALSLEDFAPTVAAVNTPYTVSGRIVDENGDPYSGKRVTLSVQNGEGSAGFKSLGSVMTDQNGAFSKEVSEALPTRPGTRQFQVRTDSDYAYKALDGRPALTFVDQLPTHTVTFNIVNGAWDDDATQKTVTLAEGSTIQAEDLPVPQPDSGYGTGKWDTDPVGKTVNGDVTYTWTYTHYKVSYVLVNDDASIGTAPADTETVWWSTGRCEVVGYDAAQAQPTLLDDRYDFDGWYTDQACTQAADAWAALTGDVTLYGKWTGPFTVIDQVQLDFTPPVVGDPIPTGQYYAFSDAGSRPADLGVTQPSSMDDKTLVVFAAYELDGSEGSTFEAGKTYTLRLQVGPAYPLTQRFKGHSGGEAYALTVAGATGSTIVVSPTMTEVNLSVTPVPVQRTVTVAADPTAGGTVAGGGTMAEGQETTVTATANDAYVFSGWYEGDTKVSDEASYTFTVSDDRNLTAKFKKSTQLLNHNKVAVPDQEVGVGRTSATTFGVWADGGSAQLDFECIKDRINILLDGTAVSENIRFDGTSGSTIQYTGNGRFVLLCSGAELGPVGSEHAVEVRYEGDDTYAPCSASYKLKVVSIRSLYVAEFSPTIAEVNKPFTISGRILDENDQPAVDQYVQVLPKVGPGYYVFSDQDGRFSVEVDRYIPSEPGQTMLVDVFVTSNLYEELMEHYSITFTDRHAVTVTAEPAEGGTVTGGGAYFEGESATLVAAAAEGYEFDGWWDGEDNVSWYEEYTIPEVTGDIALTARFAKMWTVTVDMNGGTIGGAESSAMEFRDGHVGRIPTAEDMAGWIADGTWITGPAGSEYVGAEITDASGTKAYRPGDAYTVVGDAAIKVLWKPAMVPPGPPAPPAVYTITYDLNGGTLDGKTGVVTVEAESGSTITLPAPTREGYTFDHWKGSRYSAGDSYTVEGDHTLTAQWRKDAPAAPAGKGDTGKASPGTGASDAGKSSPGKSDAGKGSPGKALPKTGDGSDTALWLGVALAASLLGMALALLAVRRKRPRD